MELMTKLNHVTLDIIGLCAFGYRFNSVVNGYNEESRCISDIVAANCGIHRKLIESKLPFLKLIPSKAREESNTAEKACLDLIQKVKRSNSCIQVTRCSGLSKEVKHRKLPASLSMDGVTEELFIRGGGGGGAGST